MSLFGQQSLAINLILKQLFMGLSDPFTESFHSALVMVFHMTCEP